MKKNSFTLIETLVAIFVFILLMGAVSGAILMLYRTHDYQWQQSLAIEEARRGIETMAWELREARQGENGAYPIEYAGDKEIIFYSDIDNDGKTERVRYFLGEIVNQTLTQKCVTFTSGGTCSVSFSNFFSGVLKSAQARVSVEGDLGSSNEYVDIYVDSQNLGRLCVSGCTDCAGTWQGTQIFDVFSYAQDNSLSFLADASSRVNSGTGEPTCNWEEPAHKMKANFELTFSQEIQGTELKKGVIEPEGDPPTYLSDQEKIFVITSYVRNAPPIFEYLDKDNQKIENYPVRLGDIRGMRVYLVVNIDPNRPPNEFEIKSYVQLRNLKSE